MKKLSLFNYISLLLVVVSLVTFFISNNKSLFVLCITFIFIPSSLKDIISDHSHKVIKIICSIIAFVILGYSFYTDM